MSTVLKNYYCYVMKLDEMRDQIKDFVYNNHNLNKLTQEQVSRATDGIVTLLLNFFQDIGFNILEGPQPSTRICHTLFDKTILNEFIEEVLLEQYKNVIFGLCKNTIFVNKVYIKNMGSEHLLIYLSEDDVVRAPDEESDNISSEGSSDIG